MKNRVTRTYPTQISGIGNGQPSLKIATLILQKRLQIVPTLSRLAWNTRRMKRICKLNSVRYRSRIPLTWKNHVSRTLTRNSNVVNTLLAKSTELHPLLVLAVSRATVRNTMDVFWITMITLVKGRMIHLDRMAIRRLGMTHRNVLPSRS